MSWRFPSGQEAQDCGKCFLTTAGVNSFGHPTGGCWAIWTMISTLGLSVASCPNVIASRRSGEATVKYLVRQHFLFLHWEKMSNGDLKRISASREEVGNILDLLDSMKALNAFVTSKVGWKIVKVSSKIVTKLSLTAEERRRPYQVPGSKGLGQVSLRLIRKQLLIFFCLEGEYLDCL